MCWSCIPTQKEQEYYANPVIAGDFPDPSVIRVGEHYYATGTSCDFAPDYPIYESQDLVNWERIGSVFSRPPAWASDDFWAPELFYKDGTYFVYYTTKRKDNGIACVGVATTKDMHKGFTDHGIIIEWGEEAIDAFVFQDDDGKTYITWKAYGLTEGRDIEILCSELSDDGMRLVGDHFTLTDHTIGWQGEGDEGQVLLKRDDYYYLIYSVGGCCDNRCDYRVRVARSKQLKSGWEQYPEPILQGGEHWLCTGHGTMVTTPDDRYFYLYHSYNAKDFEFIGRQGMLDEMFWDSQAKWPYFKNGLPSSTAPVPFAGTKQKRETLFADDFSSNKNVDFWEWDINNPEPIFAIDEGKLTIKAGNTGIGFLGLRPKTGDYALSAKVMPVDQANGIGIYSNAKNYLALMLGQQGLILVQMKNGVEKILAEEPMDLTGPLYLKYESTDGRYFWFFYSENGKDWKEINIDSDAKVDGTYIAQWGYSPRVGFLFQGSEGDKYAFDDLRVEYKL